MNPADTLKGRDRAAELLRQALDTIEALPFTEPATLDRLERARLARDAVVLALRSLNTDPREPSMVELDDDRRQWLAEQCASAFDPSLPPTAEIAVTPGVDGGAGTVAAAGVAGDAGAPPTPALRARFVREPGKVARLQCVGCGTVFDGGTLEQTRDAYVAHVPDCSHEMSPNHGWHGDVIDLFVPRPFNRGATRR